jgi:hypothetical protein
MVLYDRRRQRRGGDDGDNDDVTTGPLLHASKTQNKGHSPPNHPRACAKLVPMHRWQQLDFLDFLGTW